MSEKFITVMDARSFEKFFNSTSRIMMVVLFLVTMLVTGCSGLSDINQKGSLNGNDWRYLKVYSLIEIDIYAKGRPVTTTVERTLADMHEKLAQTTSKNTELLGPLFEDNLYIVKLIRNSSRIISPTSWLVEHYVKCIPEQSLTEQKTRLIDSYKSLEASGHIFTYDITAVMPHCLDRYSGWLGQNFKKNNRTPMRGYDSISNDSYKFATFDNNQSTFYSVVIQLVNAGITAESIEATTGIPKTKLLEMVKAYNKNYVIDQDIVRNGGFWMKSIDGKVQLTNERKTFGSVGGGSESFNIEPELYLQPLPVNFNE